MLLDFDPERNQPQKIIAKILKTRVQSFAHEMGVVNSSMRFGLRTEVYVRI